MKHYLENIVKKITARFGYDIKLFQEDGSIYGSYLEALYHSTGYSAVFQCPIEFCIDSLGFSYDPKEWHPYVATGLEYAAGIVRAYPGSVLERYYEKWQPVSSAEVFPEAPDVPGGLSGYPPDLNLTPWLAGTIESRLKRTREVVAQEYKSVGWKNDHGIPAHPLFGPASLDRGVLEYGRITGLVRSIQDRGYVRPSHYGDDIAGLVLRRDDEYRFMVLAGKHRAAALSALGYAQIPVMFKTRLVIEERDVHEWPQVKRGVWTRESALRYFDRLFRSNGSEWAAVRGIIKAGG